MIPEPYLSIIIGEILLNLFMLILTIKLRQILKGDKNG